MSDAERMDNAKDKLHDIWVELQEFQVEFAFRQELSLYYRAKGWIDAVDVLEAGCGCGYYLGALHRFFPLKNYVGVDISPEYIRLAKRENPHENCSFSVSNFFDAEGAYDAIVMRLFMQHLEEPHLALEKAGSLLRKNGCLLIVDSVDGYRNYYPDMPQFSELFGTYQQQQKKQNKNRDVAAHLTSLVGKSEKWKLQVEHDIVIPSTVDNNRELFFKVYTLFVDMLEEVGEIESSYQDVRDEISQWYNEGGFTQIGLKLLAIEKK